MLLYLFLVSDKTTNLLSEKNTSKHCDTTRVEENMEHDNVDTDDLNILNKCTTDDDKVNSVQKSIKFFDKPIPSKLDKAKTVWNDVANDADGKRWSYQKAIEMKYNKQNNKDSKLVIKEDVTGSKQSIILDKINKLKESQDKASKSELRSKLQDPTKLKRNLSNEETNSNINFSLKYKSPYFDNRRNSLNNIDNTLNLAVDKTLTRKLDNNLSLERQKTSNKQQKIGNVNLKSNKLKEFEKVLISNQMKNISNKFENRVSKSKESSAISIPEKTVSVDNGFNINKLNLNHEPSKVDRITEKTSDIDAEKGIDSPTSLEKNLSMHGSVKNLTETSFLNISSTSLNKESEDIDKESDEDRTKINRTIQDIESIAQQIESLTFNVNTIVNKHSNSDPIKSDINQPTIDTKGDINQLDADKTTSNPGAIADEVTQNNENFQSHITAIEKTLQDNVDIVTAINQSHNMYHEIEMKDLPLDGLEDEPEVGKEKSCSEKNKLKLDLKDNISKFQDDIKPFSKDVENNVRPIDEDLEKSNNVKSSYLSDSIYSTNMFKNSPNGSPLPDVVIGLVEQLNVSNECRLEGEKLCEDVKKNDIKEDSDKEIIHEHDIDKINKDIKDEFTKVDNSEQIHTIGQDHIAENIVITVEADKKDTIAEKMNPFGDSDEEIENENSEEKAEPHHSKAEDINAPNKEKDSEEEIPLTKAASTRDIDYPEDLNPFGDDEEDTSLDVSKSSLDFSRTSNSALESTNPFGDDFDDDLDKTNPFFSDLEEEEEVELKKKPVPTPR